MTVINEILKKYIIKLLIVFEKKYSHCLDKILFKR